MKNRIALAIVRDVKIYECIVEELICMGFEVDLFLAFSNSNISYIDKKINSILKRINVQRKDKKIIILKQAYEKDLMERIRSYDYGLVIRPDAFGVDFLYKLNERTGKTIAYQWDGMARFVGAEERLGYFDKFYVYEDGDTVKYPGTFKAGNFYFNNVIRVFKNNEKRYDAYYLGTFDARIGKIIEVCEALLHAGLSLDIKIPCSDKNKKALEDYPYINTDRVSYAYRENLRMVSHSSVVLDFGHDNLHEGLSFRPFEAMGFGLKCITTNPIISVQEFYNGNNYLYYSEDTDIRGFLSRPYLYDPCVENYSFSSWIERYLLD